MYSGGAVWRGCEWGVYTEAKDGLCGIRGHLLRSPKVPRRKVERRLASRKPDRWLLLGRVESFWDLTCRMGKPCVHAV